MLIHVSKYETFRFLCSHALLILGESSKSVSEVVHEQSQFQDLLN